MRRIVYLICILISPVVFSSCEMKDELTGKNIKTSYGDVFLNISNNSEVYSRTDADFSGSAPGVFPEEEVNVDNYTLKIINSEGSEVEGGGKISDLKKNGNISLPLLEGTYTIKAFNYDGSNETVSERPYFIGENTVTVQPGIDTQTDVVCKLNNMEIAVFADENFYTKFEGTYEFTIDNGEGAILKVNKDNINKKSYMKVPVGKNYINVVVKATTKPLLGSQGIVKSFKVTKPADDEGGNDLAASDAFTIRISDEGSTASYISLGMSVDFSFKDQEEIVTIPVEDIVFGTEPTDPEPEPGDAITFVGLPAEYTDPADTSTPVVVTINAKNGIENLFVTISSNNEGFMNIIEAMNLSHFDLVNPGIAEEDLIGLGLINPEEPIKGKKEHIFDVSSFMGMLPGFGASVNTFSIEVVDSQGNKNSGDLKVTITKG